MVPRAVRCHLAPLEINTPKNASCAVPAPPTGTDGAGDTHVTSADDARRVADGGGERSVQRISEDKLFLYISPNGERTFEGSSQH